MIISPAFIRVRMLFQHTDELWLRLAGILFQSDGRLHEGIEHERSKKSAQYGADSAIDFPLLCLFHSGIRHVLILKVTDGFPVIPVPSFLHSFSPLPNEEGRYDWLERNIFSTVDTVLYGHVIFWLRVDIILYIVFS